MSKSSGYSLTDFGMMILDQVRMPAYAEALRRHVRPGMVVADLGAGTGVFSLLACQLGAARVYAIEPDAAIRVARETAAANGFADRMVCIEGMSTDVSLPEQVDLVVSDMRGGLPLLDFHLPAIKDARERLLKPGGMLIPQRDTLYCTPVESAGDHARLVRPWCENDLGLNLEAARKYVERTHWKCNMTPANMLADAAQWAVLDYPAIVSADVHGTMAWTIARGGQLHGFCLWFDARLCDGVEYSNAPGQPETVYEQIFLPLKEAVRVEAGDGLRLQLHANLLRGDYLYRWDTRLMSPDGAVKREFKQSSLGSYPILKDELIRREQCHRPHLGEQGHIDLFVLDGMARAQSLGEIARGLAESFPTRFRDWRQALDVVADHSVKYSR